MAHWIAEPEPVTKKNGPMIEGSFFLFPRYAISITIPLEITLLALPTLPVSPNGPPRKEAARR